MTFYTITEEELVKKFGTDAQKKSYKKYGRFVGRYKECLLKKLSISYDIEQIEKRLYKISEKDSYVPPNIFKKMNTSLYKFIIPAILRNITDEDRIDNITESLSDWAKIINMVNRNFRLVEFNMPQTADMSTYPLELVKEFVVCIKKHMDWYIMRSFNYLESINCIKVNEIYYVNQEKQDGEIKLDRKGNVNVNIIVSHHRATEEELTYYNQCIKLADYKACIKKKQERYYGRKSKRFNNVLTDELLKKNITGVYKTYEVQCVDFRKCKILIDQFGNPNLNTLADKFYQEFSELILKNAARRHDKNPCKYSYCHGKEDYLECIIGMCDMVLNWRCESIVERIYERKNNYTLNVNRTYREE